MMLILAALHALAFLASANLQQCSFLPEGTSCQYSPVYCCPKEFSQCCSNPTVSYCCNATSTCCMNAQGCAGPGYKCCPQGKTMCRVEEECPTSNDAQCSSTCCPKGTTCNKGRCESPTSKRPVVINRSADPCWYVSAGTVCNPGGAPGKCCPASAPKCCGTDGSLCCRNGETCCPNMNACAPPGYKCCGSGANGFLCPNDRNCPFTSDPNDPCSHQCCQKGFSTCKNGYCVPDSISAVPVPGV